MTLLKVLGLPSVPLFLFTRSKPGESPAALVPFLLLFLLPAPCPSLCVHLGSRSCQDTGCRVNGGICNSMCICVSRFNNGTEANKLHFGEAKCMAKDRECLWP
ncbi:hypothetical protein niasHS_017549 [Heterodera schachtii]|uniref:Uncharacterized protein n=1 Tax=Heterodera schachtii TaxID=97005 RepID=A0ABD2I3Y6_HETSC